MEFHFSKDLGVLTAQLKRADRQKTRVLLSEQDDQTLWSLFKEGHLEALEILFKKYHRQVLVLTYNRLNANGDVSLAQVKDGLGDLLEKMLLGRYQSEHIKKNFTAFAVHHLSFLVRSKMRLTANSKVDGLAVVEHGLTYSTPHLRVEEKMDIRKIIDLIPMITNRVYRNVLWLVFILGYNSRDLTEIFGQREKAYDKRSRAMKAFRNLLEREGYLEELR
ncbi:MAG: hypothetical protein AAFZ15_04900 [Bacteroidota bacterium]